MSITRDKIIEEGKRRGMSFLTLGQLLAKLGKSRKEAIDIFTQIYKEEGEKEEFAKIKAVSTVEEQFDPYAKKWM